jgi:hypothetical protein
MVANELHHRDRAKVPQKKSHGREKRSVGIAEISARKIKRKTEPQTKKSVFKQLRILVIRSTALSRNKTSSLARMRTECSSDQNKRTHLKRGEFKSLRLHEWQNNLSRE